MAPLLFTVTVLIWGTTWYAIKLQIGLVPAEVSIIYRFSLAAIVLVSILIITKRLRPPPVRYLPSLAAQGICLFCLNFLFMYFASDLLPSGMISVVFAMATLFNVANDWLLRGNRPSRRAILASMIGLCGLGLLFAEEMRQFGQDDNGVIGLVLALAGTYCFSLGNLLSARHQRIGLDLATTTAYGMICGVAVLCAIVLARDIPFSLDPSPVYVGALFYLAVPGSIIGFLCYLTLVGHWGPAPASYVTVLFPLVALSISTLMESYNWTTEGGVGLALALGGNLIMFGVPRRRLKKSDQYKRENIDVSNSILPQATQTHQD